MVEKLFTGLIAYSGSNYDIYTKHPLIKLKYNYEDIS